MDQNEPPPSTGLIAGKYLLVGIIGRGGMGSVWEGRHTSLGKRVAIKFIEAEYANSTEARQRFDNEAHAAARIQSKHAIEIYDHGVTDDGKPYIVMEFLSGEPLDKRIERMGRLSLQETARILQQVCRGLARAHEQGVIHRDLKPENIFLVKSFDDDEEIAKVLDFGIAKMKGPPGSSPGGSGGVSSGTKTGSVLGTPFYMSPEQARGLKIVDHRTDVWSLGVIAYKCVTGVLPFEGESVGDLLVKICTSPLPVPSQFLQGLPLAFDQWFARALDRDPERRFATVQELSDALAYAAGITVRRGAGGEPIAAPTAYAATAQATPDLLGRPGYTPGGNATPRPRSQPPPPGGTSSSGNSQQGGYPQQAVSGSFAQQASGTSAPFTASAHAPASSGRGAVIASTIIAAVLALGIGGFVVTKYMGTRTTATATPPPISTAAVSLAAGASLPPPTPAVPTVPVTSVPALATNDAPDAGAVAVVTPPRPGGRGKPGKPPVVVPPPKPGGTVVTPPPLPLPPPTPKPPSNTPQDPGY